MAMGCPHYRLRVVTVDEEPDLQERVRRPWTCEDCNSAAVFSRFPMVFVLELLLKERANGQKAKRR